MGEVVEMKELHSYIMNGKKVAGVAYEKDGEFIEIENLLKKSAMVRCFSGRIPITKNDLKQLMIMWLALNYPDVLQYDED